MADKNPALTRLKENTEIKRLLNEHTEHAPTEVTKQADLNLLPADDPVSQQRRRAEELLLRVSSEAQQSEVSRLLEAHGPKRSASAVASEGLRDQLAAEMDSE
jgi:hypothetical protein